MRELFPWTWAMTNDPVHREFILPGPPCLSFSASHWGKQSSYWRLTLFVFPWKVSFSWSICMSANSSNICKIRLIWSPMSKSLGHLTLSGRDGLYFTPSLYAFILGCTSRKLLYTCWITMAAVYSIVSFVACTININGGPIYSCVWDTKTSPASVACLELAPSKEVSQKCAPSSSVIWQTALSSCVEATYAGFRISRLRLSVSALGVELWLASVPRGQLWGIVSWIDRGT